MNIGKKYTYWKFINNNNIVVPVIQRDYAQGRIGKEELRKRFLTNLKDAIDNKSPEEPLVLDFVYGMQKGGDAIIPLDGQQRLTTLWLLHWYAFLKSNVNDRKYLEDILSKFSYDTRLSSRLFIQELCEYCNVERLRNRPDISNTITEQTWFLKEWEQDPTVKAMLNMLGGKDCSIEAVFSDVDKLWEQLTGNNCPIVFYYLPIDGEIQQEPDDIYIKMNARGEHLTDFENFKADLIKYVRDDKKDDWKSAFDNNDNPELELSRLIDTEWTDVFWNNLSDNQKVISKDKPLPNTDRQFFAFLNRYFVNCILIQNLSADELTEKKDANKDDDRAKVKLFQHLYGKSGSADTSVCYKDFDIYKKAGVITSDNFQAIKNIMTVLSDKSYTEVLDIDWIKADKSAKDFTFIPQLKTDGDPLEPVVQPITQIHRVVFFGVCCYLDSCNDSVPYDNSEFKEWMRYVWNMARNSDVQTVDSMQKVMKHLGYVKKNAHNIVYSLSTTSGADNKSYFERQKNEEIIKARLFNDKKNIIEAENIFHGSILFLLDGCLQKDMIEKASKLINKGEGNKWVSTILPFLSSVFRNNRNPIEEKKELVFYDKDNDKVKIINYNDDLVDAVKRYLKGEKPVCSEDSWVYPLIEMSSLIDNTKKIQNYYWWTKEKEKHGIYLFKSSNWSEKNCILLYSFNKDIQDKIKARNKFIIEGGFQVVTDEKDLEKDKLTDSTNPHYGRAIVVKKDSTIYYCGVDKYWDGNGFTSDYSSPENTSKR